MERKEHCTLQNEYKDMIKTQKLEKEGNRRTVKPHMYSIDVKDGTGHLVGNQESSMND